MPNSSDQIQFSSMPSSHFCIPAPIVAFDPIEGGIIFANAFLASMLDYSMEELLQKQIIDLDMHISDLFSWQIQASRRNEKNERLKPLENFATMRV